MIVVSRFQLAQSGTEEGAHCVKSKILSYKNSIKLHAKGLVTMRITIVPAGPKTSAATIRALLKKPSSSGGIEVYGVYRSLSKVPAEFKSHENFHAISGDVEDASSLDLSGADVVMTSTPPFFDGPEPFTRSEKASKNVKTPLKKPAELKG